MRYLFFDFETQGLFNRDWPSDDPRQPHIVQAAARLFTADGQDIAVMNRIARPDGWTIPADVAAIHGITTERAMQEGIPEQQVVSELLDVWRQADCRIAHNIKFDDKIMRIALVRFFGRSLADEWSNGPRHCTMEISSPIVALPPTAKMARAGFTKNKPPKLIEAHQHFFGTGFDGAHDAGIDTAAGKRVFLHLLHHGYVGGPQAAMMGDGPRRSPPPTPRPVAAKPAPLVAAGIDTEGW